MMIQTPEQRWGEFKKPLHFTGEISADNYLNRLSSIDNDNLLFLLHAINEIASWRGVEINSLAAGSSSDLTAIGYHGIDFYTHVTPIQQSDDIALPLEHRLRFERSKEVLVDHPGGSLLLFRSVTPSAQMFVKFYDEWHMQSGVGIDVTFNNPDDGSFGDVIEFHRSNNLAFCQLSR